MTDLIKRLEALEAPCRECDIEVARFKYGRDAVRRGGPGWPDDAIIVPCYPGWEIVPHYTASIDTAMTLVPEGSEWNIEKWAKNGVYAKHAKASAWVPGAERAYAATPAIALCIAALRAQEASHDR